MELARRRSERRRGKWQNIPGRRKIHGQRPQEEKKHTEQNLAMREAGSQLQWQVLRVQGEWPGVAMVRPWCLAHHCGESLGGLACVKLMAAGMVKADRSGGDINRTC